jgi:phosphate acetyltransferase
MPTNFGAGLVALGEAEGAVSGAVAPTREVLRAALWAIGTAPGARLVSSAFYMVLPDDQVLTYTDCAVIPEPSAEELAGIALAAARDRARLVGDQPRVAFLSYSTRGSAEGPMVERVRVAAARFRELAPQFPSAGEAVPHHQLDRLLDAGDVAGEPEGDERRRAVRVRGRRPADAQAKGRGHGARG